MRFRTEKVGVCLLIAAAVLCGAGAAAASDFAERPDFMVQDPEERLFELQSGLVKFLGHHPDLTTEQILAIQDLADVSDSIFLAPVLEPSAREALTESLGKLGQVLPYWDYLQLIRSFSDELRVWMVENDLATEIDADTPNCNCNGPTDCISGQCQDVTCVHEQGTRHIGRCS